MVVHQLKPNMQTLHGDYSIHHEPVLRIKSGDIVEAETLDAGWGIEAPHLDGTSRQRHPKHAQLTQAGHAMIGPIWIEEAKPDKILAVHFETIIPSDFGYTYAGGFPHRIHEGLNLIEGGEELLLWQLDTDAMIGTNQYGHKIRLNPFLGNLGMPPPEDGHHSTAPPRIWGSNLDCKDLVVGSTLYLPISVDGALFSLGDGHAAQGHGEVSVTAIECPMEKVRLRFDVLDDFSLPLPCARTPTGWITFGFADSLDEASIMALDAMVSLMMVELDIPTRKQALALATAIVDLHITQIANPIVGVHAFLPHDALNT